MLSKLFDNNYFSSSSSVVSTSIVSVASSSLHVTYSNGHCNTGLLLDFSFH